MSLPVVIYADMMSQPSRAVIWLCKLVNIPYRVQVVSIAKMQQRSDEYKTRNPFAKVPAIDDNGFLVFESHAILRYLAGKYNAPDQYYPKDIQKRTRVDQYLDWHHSNTRKAANFIFSSILGPQMGLKPNPNYIKLAQKECEQALDDIESVWLKDSPYLAGNEVTLADISAVCELKQLMIAKYNFETRPKLFAWMKKMESVPGYKEVHEILFKVSAKM